MKNTFLFLFLGLLLHTRATANTGADTLGLPGDHFDLYAMLDVFKVSASPEDFEKRLNTEGTHVNNLDLNLDGKVDYIRVVDHTKDIAHAIVLQVAINAEQSQDIAVIEIEKKGEESAQLQVIGDELLYGENYIIEPGAQKDSSGLEHKLKGFNRQTYVFVNVWYWPCVTYVYYPTYVIWVSPWYWMYYPMWWYPWPPVMWVVYYDWVYPCHSHYYFVHEHHMTHAHNVYAPRRTVSPDFQTRTAPARKQHEDRKNIPAKPTQAPDQPKQPAPPDKKQPAPTPAPGQPKQPAPQPPAPKPHVNPKPPAPAPAPAPAPKPAPKPRPK